MFVLPGISCVYRVLIMNTINFGERNSGSQVGINNGVINLGAGKSATALAMGLMSDLLTASSSTRATGISL